MKLNIPKISIKDLLKIILVGNFCVVTILSIVLAILSVLKIEPIIFNEKEYFGLQGVAICILYIPLLTLALTFSAGTFTMFGYWIAKSLDKSK